MDATISVRVPLAYGARVTIRAKLAVAIALTVLGPVVTIGVALAAFGTLGDRFDDVRASGDRQGVALELKFAVTDMNGWQTAYGYDSGRSRGRFVTAAAAAKHQLDRAQALLRTPRDRRLLGTLSSAFDDFMALDERAWAALQAGREGVTKRLLLGPELEHFETMATAADQLAAEQARQAEATEREFDSARHDAKRQLVFVGIGAGVVIVLLLLTVQDVVRLALERPTA
jgi:hypothetical protein